LNRSALAGRGVFGAATWVRPRSPSLVGTLLGEGMLFTTCFAGDAQSQTVNGSGPGRGLRNVLAGP